jgi:hypothetical protein
MSQPQPDSPPPPGDDLAKVQRWLDSLDRCQGWKEWLLPRLEADLALAKENVLTAAKEGRVAADPKALADLRTLEPLFDMIKTQRARVLAATR